MAALGSASLTSRSIVAEAHSAEGMLHLSSSFAPGPAPLSFSRSVAQPLALSLPSQGQGQCRPQHGPLVVEAAKGGTQLFRLGRDKPEGTTILRGKKRGDGTQKLVQRNRGGTKKITYTTSPEEVSAAPAGLFGGIVLPFANLFKSKSADPKTVFVAGATGQTGSRVVLELLSAGFSVRAGVDAAKSGVEDLESLASQYRELIGSDAAKRLSIVQYSASDADFTAKAIDNAGKLVVALGPEENGPKASLTPQAGLVLLQAAEAAKVPYLVLVTIALEGSSGGNDNGGFFGAIFGFLSSLVQGGASFSDLLAAVVDSSVKFTIIRTGQTAGVPDSFAEESNIIIAPEGKISSGSISKLQVAKVVAELFSSAGAGENKVFDVIARSDAEAVPIPQLLAAVPTDGRRTAKEAAKARAEAEAKEREFKAAAEAEARAVAADAKAATEALAALEAEAKKFAAEEARIAAAEAKAQARAQAAKASVQDLTQSLKSVGQSALPSAPTPKSVIPSFASLVPNIPAPTPSSVAAAAKSTAARFKTEPEPSGTTKQRRPLRQRSESRPKAPPPEPKPAAPPAPPPEKQKLFGGVFGEQETVYVDSELGDY